MANSEGSEAMLNRVMTKDNIGVAVLLELRKELIEMSCKFVVNPVVDWIDSFHIHTHTYFGSEKSFRRAVKKTKMDD